MGIRAVANYTGKRSCHRMPGGGFDSASELILAFNGPKVWYDLSNVATLQQDSAGTIPVALAGDPIGRVMDISGANNHAVQATAASRPLWQTTFAALDGVNDSWGTAAIDFSTTNQLTIIVGVRKLSDAAIGVLTELSPDQNTNNGSILILAPFSAAGPNLTFSVKGTSSVGVAATGLTSPVSFVMSGQTNIGLPRTTTRINAVQSGSSNTTLGTGNFGNYPLFIGRRNNTSLPFNGQIYGLIVLGRSVSAAELRMLEQYMASKVGIVI